MKKILSRILLVVMVFGVSAAGFMTSINDRNCSVSASNGYMWVNDVRATEHGISIGLSEAEVYEMIIFAQTGGNGYAEYGVPAPTASYVEALLNDGYCRAYIDSFKQYGIIPSNFSVGGSSSSSSGSSSSSSKNYTEEEIAAAWKETSRTEPTCVDEGVINYKNSLTGKTKTESIPATGVHEYEVTDEVPATCTEAGSVTYTCLACGDTYTEEVAALGHDYENTESHPASCTAEGSETYICTRCGDTYTETVEKTPHTEGDWETVKKAGLFSKGERQKTCTACGEVLETEEIAQTCPIPLAGVIGIVVAVIAVGAGVTVFVVKKKKK